MLVVATERSLKGEHHGRLLTARNCRCAHRIVGTKADIVGEMPKAKAIGTQHGLGALAGCLELGRPNAAYAFVAEATVLRVLHANSQTSL